MGLDCILKGFMKTDCGQKITVNESASAKHTINHFTTNNKKKWVQKLTNYYFNLSCVECTLYTNAPKYTLSRLINSSVVSSLALRCT